MNAIIINGHKRNVKVGSKSTREEPFQKAGKLFKCNVLILSRFDCRISKDSIGSHSLTLIRPGIIIYFLF